MSWLSEKVRVTARSSQPTGSYGLLAAEVSRLVRATAAGVVRRRRIGAQWSRAIDDTGRHMGSWNRWRLETGLDPLIDRGGFVEDVGARPALAMPHPRHHE